MNQQKNAKFSKLYREITANFQNNYREKAANYQNSAAKMPRFSNLPPRIYRELRRFQNNRYHKIQHNLPRLSKAFERGRKADRIPVCLILQTQLFCNGEYPAPNIFTIQDVNL